MSSRKRLDEEAEMQDNHTKNTPVATIHGIIDILVLLRGKSAAELRSQITNVELDRVRTLYEVQDTNCILNTVRFRDRAGGFKNNNTLVATIHGIIDILVLFPGKSAAKLRSQLSRLRER